MMDDIQEIQVKFIPGEHCFLENIQIQLREIKVGFKVLGSVAIIFQGDGRYSGSLVKLLLIFIFSGRGVYDHHLLCRT